jgi:hypothetical protein
MGKLIGMIIGRQMSESFGAGNACKIIGGIFILINAAMLINYSSNALLVTDKNEWTRNGGKIFAQTHDDHTLIYYRTGENATSASVIKDKFQKVGQVKTVYYDPIDPSQIVLYHAETGNKNWERVSGKIIEIDGDFITVQFNHPVYTYAIIPPIKLTDEDGIKPYSTIYSKIGNPDAIALELWEFEQEGVAAIVGITFGSIFFAFGILVNKKINKKRKRKDEQS